MEIPTKFKETLTDINEKKISEIDDEVKKLHLKINEINSRIEYLENVKAVILVNQKLDNKPESGQQEEPVRRPIKVTFV